MNETPNPRRVQEGYTTGFRSLASRSVTGLARTRVTPNTLTVSGVSLCLVAAVLVGFEYENPWLFYWLGAGSSSSARSSTSSTARSRASAGSRRRSARSSTRRPIGSARRPCSLRSPSSSPAPASSGRSWSRSPRSPARSSSPTPARRPRPSVCGPRRLRLAGRARRLLTAGLVLAPWGGLPWAIVALCAIAWLTVVQRILHVRTQLRSGGSDAR